MRLETKVKKMDEKIKKFETLAMENNLHTYFMFNGSISVQAQLRIKTSYLLTYNVDHIKYPKDLSKSNKALWDEMYRLKFKISKITRISQDNSYHEFDINERRKNGVEERAKVKNELYLEKAAKYVEEIRKACLPSNLKSIRNEIKTLQAQQKELLKKLRKSNSEFLAKKRKEKEELAIKNTKALEEGRFWDADKTAIKDYFNPPFEKNYLADVSEKWRAALFTECESVSWKDGYGNRHHKLVGSGSGYLCGIDDNGDEWGHEVNELPQITDDYYNLSVEATIEEAMAEIFDIAESKLEDCQRQGDLLFYKTKIPSSTKLSPHNGHWEIRESHVIKSNNLQRNGKYFESESPIHIEHTSHAPITLPAGSYKLYESQVEDAD